MTASWLTTNSLLTILLTGSATFFIGIQVRKCQVVLRLKKVRRKIEILQSEQSNTSRLRRLRFEERRLERERHLLGEQRLKRKKRLRSEHVRPAHFLLAIAVRLLPPLERDRYLEEFRAELLDVPRDTRLSHVLSLVRGVFVLRLRRGPQNKAADAAARRAKG